MSEPPESEPRLDNDARPSLNPPDAPDASQEGGDQIPAWMLETPEPLPPELLPPQPPQQPPREPFWGYHDLLIFLGAAPVALILGALLVKGIFVALRLHPKTEVVELLPEQFLGYVLLFGLLAAIFRIWYDRPFWQSLGWKPLRLPFSLVIVAGMTTGIIVALGAGLIHVPTGPNPMTNLMQGRTALIAMGIFGVTIAPIAEELAFRGFLQPLLVRTFGAAGGIILTAIPFGLLHFQEYGDSWTHVLLICFAGAMFGLMRHLTGSTKAAALMHASYNALFFIGVFSAGVATHQS